ncbi:MAG: DUF4333 domain-containing protein [Pseudonocardia sediminis]
MSATVRIARLALAAGAAGALVLSTSACTSQVPRADVASTIATQFTAKGVPIDGGTVLCAEDLPAEIGRSITCEFTSDGQPVGAVATVSAVEGDTAKFDVVTQARAIPSAVLAKKVDAIVTDQVGVEVQTATCSGDLQPSTGATAPCTITSDGESMDVVTTVTQVDGGEVNFSIDAAGDAR